ncbi:unnamed protein product, partial [Gulo gulo]
SGRFQAPPLPSPLGPIGQLAGRTQAPVPPLRGPCCSKETAARSPGVPWPHPLRTRRGRGS